MESDAADINPIGRQPNNRKKEIQSAPFNTHFEIDSIVLRECGLYEIQAGRSFVSR